MQKHYYPATFFSLFHKSSSSSDCSGFSVTVAVGLSAIWTAGLSLLPAAEDKYSGSKFNYLVYCGIVTILYCNSQVCLEELTKYHML